MQYCKNPIFTKGRIVKKESLDCLNDFPKTLAALEYDSYSDGILFGFSMDYQNGILEISGGACIFQGEILFVEHEALTFHEYDKPVMIKLVFYEKEITEDFIVRPVEIKVADSMRLSDNEMELGRFCLAKGAVLRQEYQTLEDCKTPYNTLDITHALYAGAKESTLSPVILKLYARILLKNNTSSELDYGFAFTCLNSKRIEKETILTYLSCSMKETDLNASSNIEIYEKLLQLIRMRDQSQNRQGNRTRKEPSIL